MKRTTVWLTEEQHTFLMEQSQATGKAFSDHVRNAIDRYRATTTYIADMPEIAEEIQPWMTYEQFIGWLQFRYRLRYEGKEHNGNGDEIMKLLREILEILKNDYDTDHG